MSVLLLSAALFSLGLYGVLVRRDVIAVLASVEVMLAGPLILLVTIMAALAADSGADASGLVQAVGLIVLVIAAAEAAVGLALLLAVAKSRKTTRLDELTEVRG